MAHPRRILYLQNGSGIGGSGWSLYTLVSRLDPAAYRPLVCTTGDGPLCRRLRSVGIAVEVHPLHLFGYIATHYIYGAQEREPVAWRRGLMESLEVVRALRALPGQARLLHRLVDRHRPDLLHINSVTLLMAGVAARRLSIPVVWHVREMLASNLWGRLAGWLIPHCATYVIAISEAAARQLNPDRHNLDVIYNAVDLDQFNPSLSGTPVRQELGIPEDVPCVGFLGKLMPSKGVFDFVDAAAAVVRECPKVHFLMVGGTTGDPGELAGTAWKRALKVVLGYRPTPDYEARLRERVRELGLENRFHLAGFRTDLAAVLAAMDVVALPTWTEAFGRTVIEAMAMAKPVVATEVDAIPELIQPGETGLLVPPRSPQRLAQACLRFIQDPSLARRCGYEARLSVQTHFEAHQHVRQVQQVYESLLPQTFRE